MLSSFRCFPDACILATKDPRLIRNDHDSCKNKKTCTIVRQPNNQKTKKNQQQPSYRTGSTTYLQACQRSMSPTGVKGCPYVVQQKRMDVEGPNRIIMSAKYASREERRAFPPTPRKKEPCGHCEHPLVLHPVPTRAPKRHNVGS